MVELLLQSGANPNLEDVTKSDTSTMTGGIADINLSVSISASLFCIRASSSSARLAALADVSL